MFDNIGGKIKKLAQITCYVGMAASILGGISFIATMTSGISVISGLLIAAVGCLISWISSFCLYGFGELIVNVKIIAKNTKPTNKQVDKYAENKKKIKETLKDETIEDDETIDFKCPNCGKIVSCKKSNLKDVSKLNCPECLNNIIGQDE